MARAAGVAEAQVVALVGPDVRYIGHADAVRIGRMLAQRAAGVPLHSAERLPLFSLFANGTAARRAGVPLAVSSTLHAALVAALVFLASFNLAPRAAALRIDPTNDPMRMVFLNIPGPGGGGGGGGLREAGAGAEGRTRGPRNRQQSGTGAARARARDLDAALRSGRAFPLEAELLPAVVAPIVTAPADARTRAGVMQDTPAATESRGPGQGGGARARVPERDSVRATAAASDRDRAAARAVDRIVPAAASRRRVCCVR